MRLFSPLLFVLALVAGAPLRAQTARGPLTYEEGGPLQRTSLTVMSETVEPVASGAWRAGVWLGYANVFEQDSSASHDLFMDFERLLTVTTVRYGLAPGVEVGGRLTLETTGGGVLDPFIIWWHDLLGLGNADRDRFPEGAFGHRLTDGARTDLLRKRRRTLALDEVRLFAKWEVIGADDGRRALSLRGEVRLPVADAAMERVDVGGFALGYLRAGNWFVHAQVGLATARHRPLLAARTHRWRPSFLIGAERPLTREISAVVQWAGEGAAFHGFGDSELDAAPRNLVFGLTGTWRRAWRWEVAFQEDLPAGTPAVDFTLGVGIRRTFR